MPKLTSKLKRADFQKLSEMRLREAQLLFETGNFDGCHYLAGYSVECALKACIAKRTEQYDYPDKDTVLRSYTHVIHDLIGLTGLNDSFGAKMRGDDVLARAWVLMGYWHEDDRYRGDASEFEARDSLAAAHKVVEWLRVNW